MPVQNINQTNGIIAYAKTIEKERTKIRMFPAIIALNATTLGKNDPFEALGIAYRAGLTAIELTAGRSGRAMVTPQMDADEAKALKERCTRFGLQVLALGAHRDLAREEELMEFKALIGQAARLGCHLVTTAIRDDSDDEGFFEGLIQANAYAEEEGLLICLENHGKRHGTGCSLKPFLGAGKAVALCYDTGNCYYYGGIPPLDDLPGCAAHVGHMHLKDKAGAFDEWNFPALGEGFADLKKILSFKGLSPEATLSMEIEFTQAGTDIPTTEAAVQRSAAHLRNLLQSMQ